jgi:hypothetical protein
LLLAGGMTIASEFLRARITAFSRAHAALRLCKACLDREVARRRMMPLPGSGGANDLMDPVRDWCFQCGTWVPTLPALPAAPRPRRRAA